MFLWSFDCLTFDLPHTILKSFFFTIFHSFLSVYREHSSTFLIIPYFRLLSQFKCLCSEYLSQVIISKLCRPTNFWLSIRSCVCVYLSGVCGCARAFAHTHTHTHTQAYVERLPTQDYSTALKEERRQTNRYNKKYTQSNK